MLAPLTGVTKFNTAPAAWTNLLGAGAVYYLSNNLGRTYYDAAASDRVTQRPGLATVMSNAFNLIAAQPVLSSSNAPVTIGLTLYTDPAATKTFVDLNNFDVDSSSYVTTPTPVVDVTLNRPAWLTNGVSASATIVSPDGSLSLAALDVAGDQLHLRLPSVTNYLSVILRAERQESRNSIARPVAALAWPALDQAI